MTNIQPFSANLPTPHPGQSASQSRHNARLSEMHKAHSAGRVTKCHVVTDANDHPLCPSCGSNKDVTQLQGFGADGYMDVFAKSTRYECRRVGNITGCGTQWDETRRPVSFLERLANAEREVKLDRIVSRVHLLCDKIEQVIETIRSMSREEAADLGHFTNLRDLQRARDGLLKMRRQIELEDAG